MPIKADNPNFTGFRQPKQSWSKLPHQFVELLPQFDAMTELKVTIYILRHTWGYREYGKKKRLTIEDFVNGRKYKNGKRIDNGTGLSEQGVRDGLKRAIAHGFINCEIDDSDKARVKKYYGLNLAKAQSVALGVQSLDPQSLDPNAQTLDPYPQSSIPRTKKETKDRNHKKEKDAQPRYTDLIKAWLDVQGSKNTGAYKNVEIQASAKELYDSGITPEDMTAYTLVKKSQDFWRDKFVGFEHIANEILAWKQKTRTRAAAPVATPLPANFDAMPAPIVVPAYAKEQPHD